MLQLILEEDGVRALFRPFLRRLFSAVAVFVPQTLGMAQGAGSLGQLVKLFFGYPYGDELFLVVLAPDLQVCRFL